MNDKPNISGEVAYNVLRNGLGKEVMAQVREMLKTLSPEQVYQLGKFKEQGFPPEVEHILMVALRYMHNLNIVLSANRQQKKRWSATRC